MNVGDNQGLCPFLQSGVLLCTLIFCKHSRAVGGGTIEDNEFSGPIASGPLSSRPPRIILVSRGTVLNPPLILTTKRAAVPGTRYLLSAVSWLPKGRSVAETVPRYIPQPRYLRSLKRTLSKRPLSGPRKSLDLLKLVGCDQMRSSGGPLRESRCRRAAVAWPLREGMGRRFRGGGCPKTAKTEAGVF